ncbi:MAG: radical SAM family heme chaperone HemW [Bernardetiaceae bacterium]|jgi:oxygen-independent coproporphyrinogen-3 oxidase|nr:radical SAM family heme chaperone HemW [Bernardetiaceae bacterium]
MASLYFHIPFCKQACHYCDFHFSTLATGQPEMVAALLHELELQRDFFGPSPELQSVYFGGGTPSLLAPEQLGRLLGRASALFALAPEAEITLEANPDDLDEAKLAALRQLGINRLSIGIQSFHGPHLQWMNRAHNAQQALQCVPLAQRAGFHNLTIDLIYGIPAADHTVWQADLAQGLQLDVPHISAYCLTIEPRTAFGRWAAKGRLQPAPDEFAAHQFDLLADTLLAAGYEHYEISNFARPGFYSRHNRHYWKQGPYLGIGPSAHSYNGQYRQYNVANNARYVRALAQGQVPAEREHLTRANHINEYLMTSLRTQWGCDLAYLKTTYGHDLRTEAAATLAQWQTRGLIRLNQNSLTLTRAGQLLADGLAAELFV